MSHGVAEGLASYCSEIGLGWVDVLVSEWAGDDGSLLGWEVWAGDPPTVAFCAELICAVTDAPDLLAEYLDVTSLAIGRVAALGVTSDEDINAAVLSALESRAGGVEVVWAALCRGHDALDGKPEGLTGSSSWASELGLTDINKTGG